MQTDKSDYCRQFVIAPAKVNRRMQMLLLPLLFAGCRGDMLSSIREIISMIDGAASSWRHFGAKLTFTSKALSLFIYISYLKLETF